MAKTMYWPCLALLAAQVALGGAIREVEVTPDPPENGQQIFTVRLRPAETHHCDLILFDFFYRQEFHWLTDTNPAALKVTEPVFFTRRERDVNLTADLDKPLSFKVPVGLNRLKEIYGKTMFFTNAPVTISRLRMTGQANGETLWQIETETRGLQTVTQAIVAVETPPATNAPVAPAAP